jgi:ACS family glucarate transporter-like MFS transporter
VGKRRSHRWVAAPGLLAAGALILAAAFSPSPVAAVALLSLCLAFQQMTDAAFWSAAISVSGGRAAAATGVMNTGGNVVGGVGALLVPLTVRSAGWPAALATAAGFAAVGALLWVWIRADREFSPEGAEPAR